MKLNLVADYEIGGKHTCHVFSIHSSNNLARLADMTAIEYPAHGGGWVRIDAKTLQMCESKRRAEAVEDDWREAYKRDGQLWDYSPVDPYWAAKEQESEVAK